MNTSNGAQARSRWADRPSRPSSRPKEANEDDLALAALLGEATARDDARRTRDEPDPRPRPPRRGDDAHERYRRPGDKRLTEGDDAPDGDPTREKRRRRTEREGAPPGDAPPDGAAAAPPKAKADFGLSGALAQDARTGNAHDGVALKFSEPPEARVPNTRWRLYVFRQRPAGQAPADAADDGLLDTYHVSRQSAYLFGRERKVADIPVDHASLSKQHAVLQFRALPSKQPRPMGAPDKLQCKPYLMDLESTNGTFINGVRLEPARYYELKRGDVVTLGASSREYVVLTEQSAKTGI